MWAVIGLICLSLCFSGRGESGVLRVPADYPTIQEGVAAAASGDTVLVADGVYTGEGNRDISFYSRALVLTSENGPAKTIIDCRGTVEAEHRAFYFYGRESREAVIDGFTVRGGYAESKGGAFLIEDSSPTIRNCIITANRANHGAAIYITFDASPLLEMCRFIDNHATDVGVVHIRFGANAEFRRCAFEDNTAANGIISCYKASPLVTRCRFVDNRTDSTAGAVFVQDNSSPQFVTCWFLNNRCAGRGGAMYVEERGIVSTACAPIIDKCCFVGNQGRTGGGIYFTGPVGGEINNCTFAGNSADSGSAVFLERVGPQHLYFNRCNIVFNTGDIPVRQIESYLSFQCSNIFGHDGGDWTGDIAGELGQKGNISQDPLHDGLVGRGLNPRPDSPCAPANNGCGVLIGALPVSGAAR